MLVLTRKEGETIHIADDIVVTVLNFSRGKIRIGIDAPKHIMIYRGEVYKNVRKGIVKSIRGESNAGFAGEIPSQP